MNYIKYRHTALKLIGKIIINMEDPMRTSSVEKAKYLTLTDVKMHLLFTRSILEPNGYHITSILVLMLLKH